MRYRFLINSYISHDECVSVNNVLRGYDDMKEEHKYLKAWTILKDFNLFIKQIDLNDWSIEKNRQ